MVVSDIRAILEHRCLMDRVLWSGQMETSMMALLRMASETAKAEESMLMGAHSMATMKRTNHQATAFTNGKTARATKANGKTASSMARD